MANPSIIGINAGDRSAEGMTVPNYNLSAGMVCNSCNTGQIWPTGKVYGCHIHILDPGTTAEVGKQSQIGAGARDTGDGITLSIKDTAKFRSLCADGRPRFS